MIPYGRQYITQADIEAVIATLQSDYLTQGPAIAEFENNFAQYIGCKYAVAVTNGTAALHLSAMALGVKAGSKVITTPITFAASANCIKYCGGDVDFVDIDPDTLLLDINKVKTCLEAAPKGTYSGIVVVDFAGYAADMEAFRQLANEHNLWLLEDACHAPGGYFIDSKGTKQMCGNGQYADVAIFSFHPVKHIATGEGGMITTNRRDIYEQLLLLRTHGITKNPALMGKNEGGWYHEMQILGYNYRLPDILATLGNSQLQRANAGMQRRHQIAQRYIAAFDGTNVQYTHTPSNVYHGYHLFVVQTDRRLELYNHLHSQQIFVQVHYIPCHLHPYYRQLGWTDGDMPLAEQYYSRALSLPMYPSLSNQQQDFVIEQILAFFIPN